MKETGQSLEVIQPTSTGIEYPHPSYDSFVNALAHNLYLPPEDKQALLDAHDLDPQRWLEKITWSNEKKPVKARIETDFGRRRINLRSDRELPENIDENTPADLALNVLAVDEARKQVLKRDAPEMAKRRDFKKALNPQQPQKEARRILRSLAKKRPRSRIAALTVGDVIRGLPRPRVVETLATLSLLAAGCSGSVDAQEPVLVEPDTGPQVTLVAPDGFNDTQKIPPPTEQTGNPAPEVTPTSPAEILKDSGHTEEIIWEPGAYNATNQDGEILAVWKEGAWEILIPTSLPDGVSEEQAHLEGNKLALNDNGVVIAEYVEGEWRLVEFELSLSAEQIQERHEYHLAVLNRHPEKYELSNYDYSDYFDNQLAAPIIFNPTILKIHFQDGQLDLLVTWGNKLFRFSPDLVTFFQDLENVKFVYPESMTIQDILKLSEVINAPAAFTVGLNDTAPMSGVSDVEAACALGSDDPALDKANSICSRIPPEKRPDSPEEFISWLESEMTSYDAFLLEGDWWDNPSIPVVGEDFLNEASIQVDNLNR